MTSPRDDLREVTEAGTLRALAHPVRVALIEVLSLHGPMTAPEAGDEIGESPTTCSFHLRQLAGVDRLRIPEVVGDVESNLAARSP